MLLHPLLIVRSLPCFSSPIWTVLVGMSMPQSETYTRKVVGTVGSLEYRLYLERNGSPISIWHDIPLYCDDDKKILNMVVEIPRWSNAKLEVRGIE